MVARSDLTPLGLRLAELLVEGAAVVTAPSCGGAIALGKGVYEWWQDIAALGKPGSKAADALGTEIASRLEAAVKDARRRYTEQGLDVELLPGAATEVAALLEQVIADGGAVVAAVQDPDRFEDLLSEHGQEFRKKVEEKAEPLFDELVRTVAREFTSLATGSSRFGLEALKQLLNNDSEALAILHRMEAKQEASHNDIAEIKADVKDRAKVVNTPHAPVPARPSRIRFGSRPMEALGFVTRSEQEDLFRAVFSAAAPRTVLVGMHGCGKSQLAAAVAARCVEEEWPLVAWVNAESRGSVLEGLSELGQRMGVGETDDRTPETLAQRCLRALEEAEEADRLVVFDNVERADDLRGFIPRGESLRVVATTTKRVDWAQAWRPIHVGGFEREQSIAMLLGRTGEADRDAANTIADALEDLPVAVSQAAATVKRSRCSLSTYLDRLRKYSLEDSIRRLDGDEYPDAVGSALRFAFQSALEEIGKQNPRWEEIASCQLGILALLAASGVPKRWLEGTDQDSSDRSTLDAGEALSSLVEFSVCQFSEDGAKATLHRLQSRVIRENWKNEPKEQAHAEEDAIDFLSSVDTTRVRNPKNGARRQDAVDLADQLRAVSEQDYSHALFSDPRFGNFFSSTLWHAAELGAPQAVIALSGAVDHLGKILGDDHPQTLASRNNLAHAHYSAGRLDAAIPLYEEVLADRVRLLGEDHPDTLTSRNNLAGAYYSAGRLGEAIPLLEGVLADRVRVLGDDHPDTLASRNNLAGAYESAGRLDEAIPLYEQVAADSARVLGDDHPHTLASRNNLAGAYESAGRLDEAIPLYEQVTADRVRVLGKDHPDTLTSRNNLAYAYESAGRLGEAIRRYEKVLADRVRVLGEDHPHTLTSRNNLAHAYQAAGRLDEAITLFKQNLNDSLRLLGADHPDTLTSRNNLAYAYQAAGRLDEAITLFKQNLNDSLRLLGPDHPDTLTSRNNLAYAYLAAGCLDDAITLYEQVLADSARVLGDNHPHTLASRNNLASTYESAGRLDEAIALFEETLADSLRVLGPDHPHTLASRNNLASAYESAGRLNEAITLYEETLADSLRVLGPDHPHTLASRNNLASAYESAGRLDDAKALFDQPTDPDGTGTDRADN